MVQSTAPGLAAGSVINAQTPLDIPKGSTVTVISQSGQSKTIIGPHAGPADLQAGGGKGDDASLVATLSGLFQGGAQDTMALGVMRSAPPPGANDPWVIDTNRSGHHCLRASGDVLLWRSDASRSQTLSVRAKNGGVGDARVDWARGAPTLAWPNAVPIRDGGIYLLQTQDGRIAKRVILHLPSGDFATDAHAAAWMARTGCRAQAKTLVAAIR